MNSSSGAAPAAAVPQSPSFRRMLIGHVVLAVLLAAVLIAGSGRQDWTRAWLYIGVTVGLQAFATVAMQRRVPDLLVERSRMREGTMKWDRVLAPLVALVGPVAMWVVAAWDVRAHWPPGVPAVWSAAAYLVCGAGYGITLWAMLSNRFFSATVRLQRERGHVVVDRGPYRYVRHPGYSGAAAFTLATPFALGSWWALVPAVLTACVLVLRTGLEDRTLQRELEGYAEYAGRVRARLAPGVW